MAHFPRRPTESGGDLLWTCGEAQTVAYAARVRVNLSRSPERVMRATRTRLTTLLACLFQEEPALIDAFCALLGVTAPPDGSTWDVQTQQGIGDGFLDMVIACGAHAHVS